MSAISSIPGYNELADSLSEAKSSLNPSQVHGLLCGYICATTGINDNRWEKTVLGKQHNPECRELLQQLYETTYHQMSEFSFEFSMLLPNDDTDINFRTEALGLWCQGFLTGLEQSQIAIQNREDSELGETLNDIIEIAQVSFGDISDDDEDEMAYFELVEHVRLGALMIFEELKANNPKSNPDENDVLH
ncbi:MAG: UPF0149 family protein [Gammaproteobacteria bacterium]